jgi:hypothetical protein
MEIQSSDMMSLDPTALKYKVISLHHYTLSERYLTFHQLQANPYQYDVHLDYIRTLRLMHRHEELRHAREKMNAVYPLSEGKCENSSLTLTRPS